MSRIIFQFLSFILSIVLWVLDLLEMMIFFLLKMIGIDKRQKIMAQHSIAEEDSAYQVLHRLKNDMSDISVKTKSQLMKQVIEEKKHADIFKAHLNKIGKCEFEKSISSRLFDNALDPYFVKVGEQAAIRKYRIILSAGLMKELDESYRQILIDEKGHEDSIDISGKNIIPYCKAQFKYGQILIGKYIVIFFDFIFKVLVVPFYYLIFTPIAKLTLLFMNRRLK